MAKNEDVKPIFSENIFQTLNVEEDEIVKAQDISFGFNSIINNISLALNTIFSGVGNTRDFVLGGKITVDEAALQPAIKIAPLLCYSGKKRQSVIIPTTSSIQFTPSSKDESYIILIHLIEVNIDTRDRYKSTISATSDELKTDIASISIVKQFRGEIVALEEDTDIEKDEYIKIAEVTVTAAGEVRITGLERQEEWSKKGETNIKDVLGIGDLQNALFLEHKINGEHKDKIITKEKIHLDVTDSSKGNPLTACDISLGDKTVGSQEVLRFGQTKTILEALQNIIDSIDSIIPYINKKLDFNISHVDIIEKSDIDIRNTYPASLDSTVLLIGQNEKRENGLYTVNAMGILEPTTTEYANILFTSDYHLYYTIVNDKSSVGDHATREFIEAKATPDCIANTLALRDAQGKLHYMEPTEPGDVALFKNVNDLNQRITESINDYNFKLNNTNTRIDNLNTKHDTSYNELVERLKNEGLFARLDGTTLYIW